MKLKNLVLVSLLTFIGSCATIIAVGLIFPGSSLNSSTGGTATQQSKEGQASTESESEGQETSNDGGQQQSSQPASNGQQSSSSTTSSSSTGTTSKPSTSSTATSTPTTSTPKPAPAPTPAPAPAPAPTPAPAPACGAAGGSCTAAQVATHNTAGNCWVIYSAKYYIVSSYVSQHPGGQSVFNSQTCGKDITGYMNGSLSTAGKQNTHKASSYNILQSYYVGPVK